MVFTYQIKHFDLLNNFPLKFENSILVTPLRFIITLLNLFCFLEMLECGNKFISSYEKITLCPSKVEQGQCTSVDYTN